MLNLTNAELTGNLDRPNVVLSTANATGAFTDPNVGIDKTVQVSGLTISGSATNNYTFTQPTTNATITARAVEHHGPSGHQDLRHGQDLRAGPDGVQHRRGPTRLRRWFLLRIRPCKGPT